MPVARSTRASTLPLRLASVSRYAGVESASTLPLLENVIGDDALPTEPAVSTLPATAAATATRVRPTHSMRAGYSAKTSQPRYISDSTASVTKAVACAASANVYGPGFTASNCETPGAPPVAVLSHDLWTNALASDPAIIGRSIE